MNTDSPSNPLKRTKSVKIEDSNKMTLSRVTKNPRYTTDYLNSTQQTASKRTNYKQLKKKVSTITNNETNMEDLLKPFKDIVEEPGKILNFYQIVSSLKNSIEQSQY